MHIHAWRTVVRKMLIIGFSWLLRPWVRRSTPQPQRILIIEPGHLGDIVLLTPALTALRTALPHAHLTLLVGPWGRSLIQHHPALDQILTCSFPGFVRGETPSPWEPYQRLWATMMRLRSGNFDIAMIARDDHWWGGLLALGAGIPWRLGMQHPLVKPSLTEALPYHPNAHVTEQRLALVQALTDQAIGRPATWFAPSDQAQIWATHWLAARNWSRPFIMMQPGSGGAAKLWLPKRWAQLAKQLTERYEIVFSGGPDDRDHVAEICQHLDQTGIAYHNLVGATNLEQLAVLFGNSAGVIGTDNGPLHLAVAQGVPTIHLFGPGDETRFGPWGDPQQHQVVREPLWCAPCGVLSHCPRGTNPSECMAGISVQQVLRATEAWS